MHIESLSIMVNQNGELCYLQSGRLQITVMRSAYLFGLMEGQRLCKLHFALTGGSRRWRYGVEILSRGSNDKHRKHFGAQTIFR